MTDLREAIAEAINQHPIGSGYYSTNVHWSEAVEMADAVLAVIEQHTTEEFGVEHQRDDGTWWNPTNYIDTTGGYADRRLANRPRATRIPSRKVSRRVTAWQPVEGES